MSSKILHIIRHGESEANILMEEKAKEMGYNGMHDGLLRMNNKERTKLLEPLYRRKTIDYKLTEKGYKQAMFLQNDIQIQSDLTLVISSTQERAIRTAAVGLGHLVDKGQARGVALDVAREFVTGEPGERRTKISERQKDPAFSSKHWDFSNCTDDDDMWLDMEKNNSFEYSWDKSSNAEPMWMQPKLREAVRKRGTAILDYIFEQSDEVIALVTHSGLAGMGIIRDRLNSDNGKTLFRGNFENCDRVTLKLTKTIKQEGVGSEGNNNIAGDDYRFEVINYRKCPLNIDQIYPTKVLHLIRHGESEQNEIMHKHGGSMAEMSDEQRHAIMAILQNRKKIDYKLTDKGRRQAMFLQNDVEIQKGLTLIISSTQERAMRTTAIGFGHLIRNGQARAVALDSPREFLSSEMGERRTKTSDRLKDPMFKHFDFSNCTEDDELYINNMKNNTFEFDFKSGIMKPPFENPELEDKIFKRGTDTLDYIFTQRNNNIVALVTHGGFSLFGIINKRLRGKQNLIDKQMFESFLGNFGNCDRITLKVTKTNDGYDVVIAGGRKCPPVDKSNQFQSKSSSSSSTRSKL
jgi:broad specificity phosphatase PhoE